MVLTLVSAYPTPTSHLGLGLYHDHSPRINTAPVPPPSNPGGFRLDIIDYERPDAPFSGTFNNAAFGSEFVAHPQPGGFVVPDSPASPHAGYTYNDYGPGANPAWTGGFGAYR
jgi:hypothetical protein